MIENEIIKEFRRLLTEIKRNKLTGPINYRLFANQGGIRNTEIVEERKKELHIRN